VFSEVLAEEGKVVGVTHVVVGLSDEKDIAMELLETPYGYETVINNLPAAMLEQASDWRFAKKLLTTTAAVFPLLVKLTAAQLSRLFFH
jgi:hypothetical protein